MEDFSVAWTMVINTPGKFMDMQRITQWQLLCPGTLYRSMAFSASFH